MSNRIILENLRGTNYRILQDIIKLYPPYSDFNLLNLLVWNIDETIEVGTLGKTIIVKMKDYFSDSYFHTLLGTENVDETLDILLEKEKSLKLIPDIVVENIKRKDKYMIQGDPDNHDYIISTEKLSTLEGSEFKSLRKKVNRFIKDYPNVKTKVVALEDVAEELIALTQEWEQKKGIDSEGSEDIRALKNLIRYSKDFDMLNIELYRGDTLIGYTINELVQDNTAIGHFGKTNTTYKNSATYLEHITSQELFKKGYLYLNHEQDTGIITLRQTKMSYKPIKLLRKWIISPKLV